MTARTHGSVAASLTVIVPAYNEAERLGAALPPVLAWLDGYAPTAQVLLVDDGSTDTTLAVCHRLAASDPRLQVASLGRNRGKGAAVRRGVELADRDWILFTDADFSTPIAELPRLSALAEAGAPIVIGSRDHKEARVERRQPLYRETMGRIFNRIVQAMALPGFSDTQCGFKLFRADVARRCFSRQTIERFAFDVEVLYVARQLGYRIEEVGVCWRNDDRSTVHPVRDASRMLVDVARIRYRHRGHSDR